MTDGLRIRQEVTVLAGMAIIGIIWIPGILLALITGADPGLVLGDHVTRVIPVLGGAPILFGLFPADRQRPIPPRNPRP